MYLFRFEEKEMVSEIRPRSMTLPGRKVHHRKMVLRKKKILLMRSFNIQGREVNMYISCKSPILQESNQPNIESPKKASIDSNSVPRTLMRSGSIGEQFLNLCQKIFPALKKCHVFAAFDKQFSLDFKNESKVLVLYTGGTIGRESHIM